MEVVVLGNQLKYTAWKHKMIRTICHSDPIQENTFLL